MLAELALRNARRSARDYAVYFVTLTFGVCLFYVFNALDSQSVMDALARNGNRVVGNIFEIIGVFSVFVTAVLAGLILYAGRFLMKRRKRELGTYFLLGMDSGKVALLLMGETLLMGIGALAAGLLLGALGSWALDKLTVGMFLSSPPGLFTFRLSWPAVGKTAVCFGCIFLLVTLFTWRSVSRARLIDLIQGGRKNEEVSRRSLGVSAALFLLGCACLGAAYAILLIRGLLRIDPIWYGMLCLGTVGTFLIFRSLSGFLLRLTRGHPGYYKGLNMFILRQWTGRVHTGCLSNTVVSILLLLAMGVTACSVGLNDTITSATREEFPYDGSLIHFSYSEDGELDLEGRLRAAGEDPEDLFERVDRLAVYRNQEEVTGIIQPTIIGVVSLSDYNALMESQGLPGLEASEVTKGAYPPNAVANGYSSRDVMVVPDEQAKELEQIREIFDLTFRGEDREGVWVRVKEGVRKALDSYGGAVLSRYQLDNYYDQMGSKLLVLYIGLYLGLVFLLTAAAVLALQQLSQAADNAGRYDLLAKLGAPEAMRRRALVTQVALAFLLPLALGTVHALVGIAAANRVIGEIGRVDALRSTLWTAAVILLVYGGYFLVTCRGAWRAVRGET